MLAIDSEQMKCGSRLMISNALFASMENDTRYWLASDLADNKFQHNADSLLDMTKKQAGKNPTHFITDKLPAYNKSCKRVFDKKTHHTSNTGIRNKRTGQNFYPSNNKIERLNGEIRDREKVFRGLKTMNTEILNGMRVYYNFTKKHGSLKGKTPTEQAKIQVEGVNKWKIIIQNASLNKATTWTYFQFHHTLVSTDPMVLQIRHGDNLVRFSICRRSIFCACAYIPKIIQKP